MSQLQCNSIVPVGGLKSGVNSGGIIQFQHYQNSTRTALSDNVSYVLWTVGNFTKASSNSLLHITGQLVFAGGSAYNQGPYWKIGASGERYDGIIHVHYSSDQVRANTIKIGWHINAYYDATETGALAVTIGWNTANGTANHPGDVWNPNATDDARSRQFSSDITIFELGK